MASELHPGELVVAARAGHSVELRQRAVHVSPTGGHQRIERAPSGGVEEDVLEERLAFGAHRPAQLARVEVEQLRILRRVLQRHVLRRRVEPEELRGKATDRLA